MSGNILQTDRSREVGVTFPVQLLFKKNSHRGGRGRLPYRPPAAALAGLARLAPKNGESDLVTSRRPGSEPGPSGRAAAAALRMARAGAPAQAVHDLDYAIRKSFQELFWKCKSI